MKIVLFGPPGAGKGTQSQKLVEKGWTQLSTGEMLRDAITKETLLGLKIKEAIDDGRFAPDEDVIQLIRDRLLIEEPENVIFDGFPRTIAQAEALNDLLSSMGTKLDLIVELDVGSREVDILCKRVVERGKTSGRSDDTAEVFRKRMVQYHAQTAPVLQFYHSRRIVPIRLVDAAQEIDVVAEQIQDCIDGLAISEHWPIRSWTFKSR